MLAKIKNFFGRGSQMAQTSQGPQKIVASVGNSTVYQRYGGAKWTGGISGSGLNMVLDNHELRQNARRAYHDSIQARTVIERMADTVVDTGLVLEATPKHDVLGIDAEEAEKWSSRVEELFDLWARDKRALLDETMNFYQAQRLVEIFQQRDNDYFVRLHYSDDTALLNPLQISFVDPSQIVGDAYTSTDGMHALVDGIERDAAGRETAYQVIVRAGGRYRPTRVPAVGGNSGRKLMLHGFQAEYAGQGRGYSRLSHALQEFENITSFSSAEIVKAINQASINMYVRPSNDAPSSMPFRFEGGTAGELGEDEAAYHCGSIARPSADAKNVTPESILPLGERVQYTPMPEATLTRPGIGVFSLEAGEDLRPFDTTSPAESYDRFVDACTAHLAASLGMPIEVLLMRFNANYSASRAALILFWRIACLWRAEIAADFLNPIYMAWMSGEIAAGRIQAPGWGDPRLRAAWLACNWVGSPMPNIDPQRTAKADKEYLEMGATTLDRVARNLNGSSGKANRAKLGREYQELHTPPWNKTNGDAKNANMGL